MTGQIANIACSRQSWVTYMYFIVVIWSFRVHGWSETSDSWFPQYSAEVSLGQNETLFLPLQTAVPREIVAWCYWEFKKTDDSYFVDFLGYDTDNKNILNITHRYQYFNFLNSNSPCEGGLWSKSKTDIEELIGVYRMVLVAKNGTKIVSPEMRVDQGKECLLEGDVKLSTTSLTTVTLSNTSSTPECPEHCHGLIGVIVFFALLVLVILILLILYWKRKLPEFCMEKIPNPEKGNADKEKSDQENQENAKLLDQEGEIKDLKEQNALLQRQIEDLNVRINKLDEDKDEKQRQINLLHETNAKIKANNEAQANELGVMEADRDNLKKQVADMQQNNASSFSAKKKPGSEQRPKSIDQTATAPSQPKENISPPSSEYGVAKKFSSAFIFGLKDMMVLKKGADLKLEAKPVEGYVLRWFRYGQNIETLENVTITHGEKDHSKIKLKIPKNSPNMSGVYTCVATKDSMSGTSQSMVKLTDGKMESPVFTKWLEDTQAKAGDTVQFVVKLTGIPVNDPVWHHKGNPVTGRANINVQVRDKTEYGLTSILTFDPCENRDSGEIKVSVDNALGSTLCTSQFIVIEGNTKPNFVRVLERQSAQIGENVTFKVIVSANPKPTIEWKHDGTVITESDRVTIKTTYDGKWTSELTINNCTTEDGGQLSVTAKNDRGSDMTDATFTVLTSQN